MYRHSLIESERARRSSERGNNEMNNENSHSSREAPQHVPSSTNKHETTSSTGALFLPSFPPLSLSHTHARNVAPASTSPARSRSTRRHRGISRGVDARACEAAVHGRAVPCAPGVPLPALRRHVGPAAHDAAWLVRHTSARARPLLLEMLNVSYVSVCLCDVLDTWHRCRTCGWCSGRAAWRASVP